MENPNFPKRRAAVFHALRGNAAPDLHKAPHSLLKALLISPKTGLLKSLQTAEATQPNSAFKVARPFQPSVLFVPFATSWSDKGKNERASSGIPLGLGGGKLLKARFKHAGERTKALSVCRGDSRGYFHAGRWRGGLGVPLSPTGPDRTGPATWTL